MISVNLTKAKLGWVDWVRGSSKLQLLWGVLGLQWSVSKSSYKKWSEEGSVVNQ